MSNVPRIFSHTHKAFIIADHKSLFLSKFVSPNRFENATIAAQFKVEFEENWTPG